MRSNLKYRFSLTSCWRVGYSASFCWTTKKLQSWMYLSPEKYITGTVSWVFSRSLPSSGNWLENMQHCHTFESRTLTHFYNG
jgi:hypothetical protein